MNALAYMMSGIRETRSETGGFSDMKHAVTEGTWDARIRRIAWGVPIALVIIGMLILLFACLQPSYTATVTEVGEMSYTPARKMVRGTSDTNQF